MPTITLFQFEECPFCAKVRAKLDEKGIKYKKVNVAHGRDDPQRNELFRKSGVPTVPVLQVDDKYIGESEAIIKYIERHLSRKF